MSNNYETDLLRPVMDRAAELAGISYDTADEKSRTSLKVPARPSVNILSAAAEAYCVSAPSEAAPDSKLQRG